MSAFPSEGTYRVVGVRTDKTRVILAERLTKERAESVVKSLADSGAFAEVLLEPESKPQS
jgi:hypothetical protein